MRILQFSLFLAILAPGSLLWAQQPGSHAYNTVFLPAIGAGDTRNPSERQSWGAFSIAQDDEAEASLTGWAIGYGTEAKARQASIEMCAERGGKGCEINLVFMNQCASVATSATETVASRDRTLRLARLASMQSCGEDCRVLYEGCAIPR